MTNTSFSIFYILQKIIYIDLEYSLYKIKINLLINILIREGINQ